MTKMTPTLTQSGLLAVLLERQQCKAVRLARRRARFRQRRTAILRAQGRPFRVFHRASAPCLAETIPHSLEPSTR